MDSYIFESTLNQFLANSNENENVDNFFNKNILSKLINTFQGNSKFKWLEVGPGDGSKTKLILNSLLKNQNILGELELTIIEPSKYWLYKLKSNCLPKAINHLKFSEKSLQEFMNHNSLSDFHFITLIQVLYNQDLTEAFLDSFTASYSSKNTTLFYINLESPWSDTAMIRYELRKIGIHTPHAQTELIKNRFLQEEIVHQTWICDDIQCQIDTTLFFKDDSYWIFPFLLGKSELEYKLLENDIKNKALNIIRNFIQNSNSSLLRLSHINILAKV